MTAESNDEEGWLDPVTDSTFRTMTIDHLGDEADESDLAAFVEACEHRQAARARATRL